VTSVSSVRTSTNVDPLASRLPVTVITGFLGSGKTTLLRRLLRHPGMNRAAVIINDQAPTALVLAAGALGAVLASAVRQAIGRRP